MNQKLSHDSDIREPLFDFLEDRFGKIRILEEKKTGASRADVVMILPEALCGIEIKSDADTYRRLASQVKDYDRYYDYNIAVVGSTHALHIREHVPSYWGVITVENSGGAWDFYVLRNPAKNPKMNWKRKLEILWRPELASLQQLHAMPKYRDKSRAFVIGKILERLEMSGPEKTLPEKKRASEPIREEDLAREVSSLLFERDYSTVKEDLAEYRRGEIARALETETDPEKRLDLMMRQETARENLSRRSPARLKRRRRRYL
ncbi:MAG: sce7726 family protein [Bilifractor sp.]|jgi:hypothetical protein